MAKTKLTKTFPQRKRRQQLKPKPQGRKKKHSASAKPSVVTETKPVPKVNRDLKILKDFDLALEYGPCIGITRMERWERADKHGMKPPAKVKDIIKRHLDDEVYTECLWNNYSILK